jgi:hypothetical protein
MIPMSIHPKEMNDQCVKETSTLLLSEVLFITAKKIKQLKWIEKVWYIYIMEYNSDIIQT